MIALVISFVLVSLFLFIMFLGTYGKLTQLEKKLDKLEREHTMVREAVISHSEVITKYMEVTDYLLIKDGGAGVYMGERGDA